MPENLNLLKQYSEEVRLAHMVLKTPIFISKRDYIVYTVVHQVSESRYYYSFFTLFNFLKRK